MVHIDFSEMEKRPTRHELIEKYELSPHCIRILQRYAGGNTDKVTAMEFGVTIKAINNVKSRTRMKLGERSNVAMIVRLVREGVI